ncbi:cyclin-dependent kinase-like 1 [Diachasma alloeum]|uniref:cyclin-dependent kinase-like 1 n=1 Tax=Diachasma alloeum TaxID=454923 RepID=UPI0007382046|nr:cyclin-dependent kinase-like 1 [Diachasma alloeum]
MEFIDRITLYDFLYDDEYRAEYILDSNKKHTLAHQLTQAVNYLHKKLTPIIQRDIKPENIMITKHWSLKLVDLGLSKCLTSVGASRTTVGTTLKGTAPYMPPEMVLHYDDASVFSDIWAVGCTIAEMYTESPVWELDEDYEVRLKEKMLDHEIPNFDAIPEELKESLEDYFKYIPQERSLSLLMCTFSNILCRV